jgi:hypothetical protein
MKFLGIIALTLVILPILGAILCIPVVNYFTFRHLFRTVFLGD